MKKRRDSTLGVRVLGYDEVTGLNCLKIAIDEVRENGGGTPHTTHLIWLALDRNYLPVRHEGYANEFNSQLPLEVGVVDKLREIGDGIWSPESSTVTVFDEVEIRPGRLRHDG
jgi:hypothetical protein